MCVSMCVRVVVVVVGGGGVVGVGGVCLCGEKQFGLVGGNFVMSN